MGITFLSIFMFPAAAFCQKASIRDVLVKGKAGHWMVSFRVENCFTEKMEEAIQSGIPTTFTYYLQIYQVRSWWRDQRVAALEFQQTIQYIPVRGEYHVTRKGQGAPRVTQNLKEAKEWMAHVQGFEIKPSSELKADTLTYLRIKAELDMVKLPLRLENLFFFVSLWDFQTDWHVEFLSS